MSKILCAIKDLLSNLFASISGGYPVVSTTTAGNTATVISSIASRLKFYAIFNTTASPLYVKFYNKASATAADTPALRLEIPAFSGANVAGLDITTFSTAMSVRATTGVADADVVSPAANDLLINIGYKV